MFVRLKQNCFIDLDQLSFARLHKKDGQPAMKMRVGPMKYRLKLKRPEIGAEFVKALFRLKHQPVEQWPVPIRNGSQTIMHLISERLESE